MSATLFSRGENPLRADKLNTAFSERLARAGDQMTGPLVLSRDPQAPFEAATKQYVDSFSLPQQYVDVTSPSYTTTPTDAFVAVNSVVPVTITLASSAIPGTALTVCDVGGHAGTANITVQPSSGTINGYANILMTQARMALNFTFTSVGWVLG